MPEGLRGAEQTRIDEIEYRPQVAQIVFDRRAGEDDARLGLQGFDGPGLFGVGVLDRLGFVENHEAPGRLADPALAQQRPIARHHQIGLRQALVAHGAQFVGGLERGMRDHDFQTRREARGFERPVGQKRSGRDQEAWRLLCRALGLCIERLK